MPSEVNTVYNKDQLALAARKLGIELVSVPASTSSELPDAALALCSMKIDAVCQVAGNLRPRASPASPRRHAAPGCRHLVS